MAPDHVLHCIPEGPSPSPVCPQERGLEVPLLGAKGQQRVTLGFAQCSLAGGISITCKRARKCKFSGPAPDSPHRGLWGWAGNLRFHEPRGSLAHSRLRTPDMTAESMDPRAGWLGLTPSSAIHWPRDSGPPRASVSPFSNGGSERVSHTGSWTELNELKLTNIENHCVPGTEHVLKH